MEYRNVLVTGGSGRLGWYVVEELLPHCDLTVLDRARPAQDVPYIEADALDLDAVRRALDGKDALVHLAAIDLGVPAEPEQYFGVNVMCAWNVLQAAHETGIRNIVIASSISATGLDETRSEFPPRYLPVDEAHAMEPVRAYSVSKLVVEEVARSFARRGDLRVMCLRPMWIAFPSTMPTLIERADDDALRWLYYYVRPEDTARAFRLALERGRRAGLRCGVPYCGRYLPWVGHPRSRAPRLRDPAGGAQARVVRGQPARLGVRWQPRAGGDRLRARIRLAHPAPAIRGR